MIEATQKKLREAQFFFHMLKKTSRQAVGNDPEQFEFILSAFLSSARAITWALQWEDKEKYDAWFIPWFQKRTNEDQQLFNFMKNQRNYAEKRGGAETRVNSDEYVPITQITTDTRGHPAYGFFWFGPPDAPLPEVALPVHSFTGSGEQVISACKRYVDILDELVKNFLETHSLPADRLDSTT
jgi:hypothetical protein